MAKRPPPPIKFSRLPEGVQNAGAWRIERQQRRGTVADVLHSILQNRTALSHAESSSSVYGWMLAQEPLSGGYGPTARIPTSWHSCRRLAGQQLAIDGSFLSERICSAKSLTTGLGADKGSRSAGFKRSVGAEATSYGEPTSTPSVSDRRASGWSASNTSAHGFPASLASAPNWRPLTDIISDQTADRIKENPHRPRASRPSTSLRSPPAPSARQFNQCHGDAVDVYPAARRADQRDGGHEHPAQFRCRPAGRLLRGKHLI